MTATQRPSRTRILFRSSAVGGLAVALAAGPVALSAATGDEPTVLTPIGGGYVTSTLQGFARAAAEGASGPTVDLVVVPSAYGDAPRDRAENLRLAQERTDQLDAACDAVVPAGCTATLAVLLTRADALDPANSAALAAPGTDGIYVLGGDQGLAMQVLAASPAETAITAAVSRGAALGGTSAGAAVESRTMINGYVGALGPADGLRRDSTIMWWGDDPDLERGLDIGSRAAIFDQHFHQRGRLGRSLSTLATADERFGGASPVGVGVDYATGVRATGDRTLSGVFGDSSVGVIDLETLGATHSWVGSPATLSARRVLTHLMTEGTTYDLQTRVMTRGGVALPAPSGAAWSAPASPSEVGGTVFLGGGALTDGVLRDVVAAARAANPAKTAKLVVLAAASGSTKEANAYGSALKKAGWTGQVTTVVHGTSAWSTSAVAGATAVVVVGDTPPALAQAMADPAFRQVVSTAVRRTPVVLTDGATSAILGSRWSAKARPTAATLEAEGVAAYRADDAQWLPGLGLVRATVVPHLTDDFRWGRLDAGVAAAPTELGLGVAAASALVLGPTGGRVSGASVVVADGREASSWVSANGAMGASGVVLDVFGSGERLAR
ncbi:Type 1 glutamine amidotransferase-like domain-containing protein [Oryzobacter telluris]|uniref:Type 1 glutamine amidotransferase-like domain-containing protein n=1 Tax=Oryzobacter telluris TaxID=3149179 RepID=UPI00370D8B7B